MRSIALVLAASLAACHYVPTPIPISGPQADLAALAGDWTGEYNSLESGRLGSITFSLRAGADTAYGDVYMTPRDSWNALFPMDAPMEHLRHAHSAQALAVQFIRVQNGTVSGTLEPYIAPDWECEVTTTFFGRITGNVISGTFVTRNALGWEQRGRWSVERTR